MEQTIFQLMTKSLRLSAVLLSTMAVVPLSAQQWSKTSQGIRVDLNKVSVNICYMNNATVRVTKTPKGKTLTRKSLVVTEQPQTVKLKIAGNDNKVTLMSDKVETDVNLQTGEVSFSNGAKQLFKEKGEAQFTPINDAGLNTYAVQQNFVLDSDEPIYGFGQPQNEHLSQRHVNRLLQPQNVEDGIPFFTSLKGYGIYWDNYSGTVFNDDNKGTWFRSEVADGIDYYFLYGGNMDGVMAQMRQLSGDVPMFPLWTYGFWQSRERYKSSKELEEVVARYRQLQIPLDGIIQDWQYWGSNYLWNAMDFLNPEFADGKEMIDSVHRSNCHIIFSIWASFGPHTLPYRELAPKNLLFHFTTWPQSGLSFWPPRKDYLSGVRVYNAYNKEARDIYWKHLTRLYNYGADGFWMDSTEPDMIDMKDSDFDEQTGMGSFRSVRSAFPLLTVGGVYDHHRQTTSDKRVFILTRSSFAGQQRYGNNVWSGDVISTWESMRKQLTAGLNFTLTGNPNYNCDLGGFFANAYNKNGIYNTACQNPAYRELYTRWIECGVFFPMMRSHGTEVYREFYYYGKQGEPVYDALVGAVKTRYSLLPYLYSTAWQVSHNRQSFMRALPMEFPNDKRVWNINEEFLLGQSLLAAPVVHSQYTPEVAKQVNAEDGWNRDNGSAQVAKLSDIDFSQQKSTRVYLPEGASWYDYWTGKRYEGGQEITKPTTIATIPMYVKAGSILPIGPDVQWATQKPWDNLTLRVYPGADGHFTLYEDEGDNYNYEKGAYTEIPMSWDESSRTLTIGKRRGQFKGMIMKRKFQVVTPDGKKKTVNYQGKAVRVKL